MCKLSFPYWKKLSEKFFKMNTLFGLVVRTFRPASYALLLHPIKISQKRAMMSEPKYFYRTNLIKISPSASEFKNQDMEELRVSFHPASTEDQVIPAVKVNHRRVKTFVDKLKDTVENSSRDMDLSNSATNNLVNHLLFYIADLDYLPLKIRINPFYQLEIDEEILSAEPKFVVNKEKRAMITVNVCIPMLDNLKSPDYYSQTIFFKQIKHPYPRNEILSKTTGYGEAQIACEILACGQDNVYRVFDGNFMDQELFAIRAISNYVTFYRAEIPASYFEEIINGLPQKHSVVIKRWPGENGQGTGLNLAEPEGRKAALSALIKIRHHLLQ
ncbi:hypothetical protein C1645_804369 [Glomus cerebriforme]|uniref:Uncharacterized protein n=1 Tax=Glomus cerebriforme TaxID=658196 RepID=A0A397T3H9_9GLOM|nr:hypothetical protein C1645_804369 [Glomus cerebriforme]